MSERKSVRTKKSRPQRRTAARKRRVLSNLQAETRPEILALTYEQRGSRLNLIRFCIVVAVGSIVSRLHQLQNNEHRKWLTLATRQHETSVEIEGARGTVLDREGRVLAASVEAAAIGLHPDRIDEESRERIATELAELTGLDQAQLLRALDRDKPFVWAAHGITPQTAEKVSAANITGVEVFPEFKRLYPQGSTAGTLLGRVGREGLGQSGIEGHFDAELKAMPLRVVTSRDARGRRMAGVTDPLGAANLESMFPNPLALLPFGVPDARAAGFNDELASRLDEQLRDEGTAVRLTIDVVVQNILEQELERARVDASAKSTFGIVLDSDSGELLAMAQSPGFNPNGRAAVSPANLRNSAIQDSFEPGSTFKPLIAALALDEKVARANETMNCENGRYKVGRRIIRDVHPVGVASFGEVLVRSSNVCMAKLGQRLGRERLRNGIAKLGFGAETGIELPGEARGILRKAADWRDIDIATHSFGQGVAVTGIQLVRAYAALANGGILVEPTMIAGSKNEHLRVLSVRAANTIGDILRGVTEHKEGTGRNAAIAGIPVYGKTGTAQKARANGRGYDPDAVVASFIGFTRGKEVGIKRSLVMLVVVDEPGVRPRWGGTVAAPAFRRSMEYILAYLATLEPAKKLERAQGA
jgi:cell division protein FtsI (penicillin-binding protein 3)